MKELWEQVQVYNVNAGDVIMINTYGHPARIDASDIDKYGGIPSLDLHCEQTVFRRIPDAEDPRVLRRALELACQDTATYDEWNDHDWIGTPELYLERARRELESEDASDQA